MVCGRGRHARDGPKSAGKVSTVVTQRRILMVSIQNARDFQVHVVKVMDVFVQLAQAPVQVEKTEVRSTRREDQ